MIDTYYLYECLRRLPKTGPTGLEGLVRSLLERWTGQRFFLAKSGSQSGRDMRAEGNLIAVESKRYGESTSLSTRELIGELHQAMNDLPGLDWLPDRLSKSF
jgi:hypothetical protein